MIRSPDGPWDVEIEGWTLDVLRIDFQVTLEFLDYRDGGSPDARVRLVLEQPFELHSADGTCRTMTPAVPMSLKPLVDVLRKKASQLSVSDAGELCLALHDGNVLHAQPVPDFESWTVHTSGGGMLVALPGGEVAVWASLDRDATPDP